MKPLYTGICEKYVGKGEKVQFFLHSNKMIKLPSEKILLVCTYLLVYMRKDKILESLPLGEGGPLNKV
jgi:ribosomal protein S4E